MNEKIEKLIYRIITRGLIDYIYLYNSNLKMINKEKSLSNHNLSSNQIINSSKSDWIQVDYDKNYKSKKNTNNYKYGTNSKFRDNKQTGNFIKKDIEKFFSKSKEEIISLLEKKILEWNIIDSNKIINDEYTEHIIKILVRSAKYEILNYILINFIKISSNNDKKFNYTALNNAVWRNEEENIKITDQDDNVIFNDILNTINVLLQNGMQFLACSIKKHDYTNKTVELKLEIQETIFGAIINSRNKLSSKIKKKLYNYYSEEYFDRDQFEKCLSSMLNKLTDKNIIIYADMILFLISREKETMLPIILKKVLFQKFNEVYIKNIIRVIFEDPLKEDFRKYFDKISLNELRNDFILILINNFEQWINEDIKNKDNYLEDDIELIKISNYSAILSIFGYFYEKRIYFNEIIYKILSMVNIKMNLIKPFENFLNTSGLQIKLKNNNFSSLENNEINLIKSFYEIYSNSSINKFRFEIERILGVNCINFIKNINTNYENDLQFKIIKIENEFSEFIEFNEFDEFDKSDEFDESDESMTDRELVSPYSILSSYSEKISNYFVSFWKKINKNNFDDCFDDILYSIEQDKSNIDEIIYSFIKSMDVIKVSDKNILYILEIFKRLEKFFKVEENYIKIQFLNIYNDKVNEYTINDILLDNPQIELLINELKNSNMVY